MSHHLSKLKIGAPILLLTLDQSKLCNGTRLTVKSLQPHVIQAPIQTGRGKVEDVFISRIPLITPETPLQFKWLTVFNDVKFCYVY